MACVVCLPPHPSLSRWHVWCSCRRTHHCRDGMCGVLAAACITVEMLRWHVWCACRPCITVEMLRWHVWCACSRMHHCRDVEMACVVCTAECITVEMACVVCLQPHASLSRWHVWCACRRMHHCRDVEMACVVCLPPRMHHCRMLKWHVWCACTCACASLIEMLRWHVWCACRLVNTIVRVTCNPCNHT